jgi:hypothetical protein
MSNHFHLVVRMHPSDHLSDDAMRERLEKWFPEGRQISDKCIEDFRIRWSSLSKFVKDIKQGFTRFYNKRHGRKGYFWGDRFTRLNRPRVYGIAVFNWVKILDRSKRSIPGQSAGLCGSQSRASRDRQTP